MTVPQLPPRRPLLPVLARMALGLALALLGGLLTWQHLALRPTPGLETTTTPLTVPLDGPLPFDLASAATLRFEGDRANINLAPLPARSPDLLLGQARHRARNPAVISSHRQAGTVFYTAQLYVRSLESGGVVVSRPEGYQHSLSARLNPGLPLTLSTYTVGGVQTLDLRTLRVRSMTARSDSGDIALTLPARMGGPYAVVTRKGRVRVTAPAGAAPEAVRVNSDVGDLSLNLGGSDLDTLSAGSQSGNVALTLPSRVSRGSVTTLSGNVSITARPGTHGNLDIRTQSGNITLKVAPGLRVRVRFTDRDTLMLPAGTPSATAPQLDVFVDTSTGKFALK